MTTTTTTALPARYFERQRARGWTVPVSPLMEYRLLRPWYTKSEHVSLSLRYLMTALQVEAAHSRAVDDAGDEYGREGSLVAGGLRDHWPENVKDKVRKLAQDTTMLFDASIAHWQAAGRTTRTWRRLRDDGGPSEWPPTSEQYVTATNVATTT